MFRYAAALAALTLVACTPVSAPETTAHGAGAVESIAFSTGPCFGACPVFNVEVGRSGEGTFRGERFVAVKGERPFTASPTEWDAFTERLAPFRPETSQKYGFENCDGPTATDHASVVVTWRYTDGTETTLDWYMGCRQPGLAENAERLYEAWEELPLDDLVGTLEDRFRYEQDQAAGG
ncbi:DUF6438 domain-containing protein [Pelagerythrobacter aerophilus]|uniref:DUF6438 domain-containing protein n=1 Tax=Pelagerythrobacter aerophilus TaxID=2306995 RepID=A0A418NJC6_9SPHN|nr:DUF6438 domain-containing protein [Pelagerythrobacter aerophilus]RIV79393.1 hypothetical protein D2V04_05230 [Pelagerythrobacter aerophilus]